MPHNYASYGLLMTIFRVKLTNNHDNTPENVYYVDTKSLEHHTIKSKGLKVCRIITHRTPFNDNIPSKVDK